METQLPPLFDYRQPAPLFFVVLLHVAALWFFQSGLHKLAPITPPAKEVVGYLISPKPQPVPVDTPPAPVIPPEPVKMTPPPPETVKVEQEPPKPVTPKKKPAKKTPPKKTKPKRPPEAPKPVSTTPSETAIAVPQDDTPAEEASAPVFEPPPAPAQPVAAPAPPVPPPPAPVEAPKFDAAYLNNPPPSYPPLSRRMSEEGRVVLRVQVGVSGKAQDISIHSSSGFPRLDDAARAAVRGWRFIPAMQGGNAVSAWVLVPLNFSLDQ